MSRWGLVLLAIGLRGLSVGGHAPRAFAAQPVVADIPQRWTPPSDPSLTIDFALAPQADAWLRDETLGDLSFDSFKHRPGNPIVRGQPPFTWPVNGFLFEDPPSGHWYAYIGYYLPGYDIGPGKPTAHCRVHRSRDHGQTWEELGPIFNDPQFCFRGDTETANGAPDVAVVYFEHRYHLVYDWFSDKLTWANVTNPPSGLDSGCAYAWAERPEGPFHRAAEPILRTSDMARRCDPTRKYSRAYGPALIRRDKDWLYLGLADSGDHFAWGLMAMTAVDPAGAWTDPQLVLSVEGDQFFPHTSESYPAMVHDGYVYAPHTSVSLNRSFQTIYRAKVEDAHKPEAWRLFQYGTAWHAEPVPNEGLGIWGQTYSGFVDGDGQLQVLFPSRERTTNFGTINLAARPWRTPLRERGCVLSGHAGPSLTMLRRAWQQFHLQAELRLTGGRARILWNYQAPLGPDRHAADATIHPLALTRHQALELTADAWQLISVDGTGQTTKLANGALPARTTAARSIDFDLRADGRARLMIDGQAQWEGSLPVGSGPIGLYVEPFTHLEVSRLAITGPSQPAILPWLYVQALTGAGVRMADWEVIHSAAYRFGVGAVRKTPGGRVKWNFRGKGFRLWSPQGPEYGRCEVLLDGRKLAELDLHTPSEQPASIVHAHADGGDGYHAVVVRAIEGRMPVDSLDVLN